MSDPITPALTPEEWAARQWVRTKGQPLAVSNTGGAGVDMLEIGSEPGQPDFILFNGERHPLAAMALRGQPFGFFHSDVELLQRMAEMVEVGSDNFEAEDEARLRVLADRIAALLPPRQ